LKVNQYVYSKDIQYWTSDETSNEYSDYTPVWFLIKCNREDPQLKIISGTAENTLLARKSNRFDFASSVSSPQAKIAAKITYYPGWQLYIDGFRNEVNQEGGQIIINLDKGSHVVSLQFRETPLRNLADMISLASLILIGGLMIKYLVFKIYGV